MRSSSSLLLLVAVGCTVALLAGIATGVVAKPIAQVLQPATAAHAPTSGAPSKARIVPPTGVPVRAEVGNADVSPKHVHLWPGSTDKANSRLVTFMVPNDVHSKQGLRASTQYGTRADKLDQRSTRSAGVLNWKAASYNYSAIIFSVYLDNLKQGTAYYYRVTADSQNWSRVFRVWVPSSNKPQRWAFFGDGGLTDPVSLPRFQYEVEHGQLSGSLHYGDYASVFDTRRLCVHAFYNSHPSFAIFCNQV